MARNGVLRGDVTGYPPGAEYAHTPYPTILSYMQRVETESVTEVVWLKFMP